MTKQNDSIKRQQILMNIKQMTYAMESSNNSFFKDVMYYSILKEKIKLKKIKSVQFNF